MAGGEVDGTSTSSVLTLLLGATAWVPLASLPRPFLPSASLPTASFSDFQNHAQALIVGGRIRMTVEGVNVEGAKNEVMSSDLECKGISMSTASGA